jgi:predicted GNAT family acetyltransferase
MTYDDQDVVVRDNPQAGRYELLVDGRLAGLATYVLSDGVMTILHAEVQPRFEGRGLGSRLARFALDDARRRGLLVVPRCPFIAAYVARHPELADLIAG